MQDTAVHQESVVAATSNTSNPVNDDSQGNQVSSWTLDTSVNPAELPPLTAAPIYSPLATTSGAAISEDTSSWSLDAPIAKSTTGERGVAKSIEVSTGTITPVATWTLDEVSPSKGTILGATSSTTHMNWADTEIPALAHMKSGSATTTTLKSPSLTGVSALLPLPGEESFDSILCVCGIKGALSEINALARKARAKAVIHVGDLGFYDETSFQRLSDKELRQAVQHSNTPDSIDRDALLKLPDYGIRNAVKNRPQLLSELMDFIQGRQMLDVPVYAIFGGQEDVKVVERVASGAYTIPNLHLINPRSSPSFEIGDSKIRGEKRTIRLFGLGGSITYHKSFDLGEGGSHSAGRDGSMWSTVLHIGEILEAAETFVDPNEIRVLMTHTTALKEGLVNLLARIIKV